MLRAAACGLGCGLLAAAVCEPGILAFFIYPWYAIVTWPMLAVAAGLLVFASVPLALLHAAGRTCLPSRVADVLLIPLGIPFGIAVCWCLRGFLGMRGEPWYVSGDIPWIPAALGAGIGLGVGCLRIAAEYD